MKKRNGIILAIVIIAVAGFAIFKSDVLLSQEQKDEKAKQKQLTAISKTIFASLPNTTFDQLESKIKSGDKVIAYFGWSQNCGDSRLFELNSFDKYLQNDKIKGITSIVNLDIDAPESLSNKDLRNPIAKRFQIDQWMKDASVKPMKLFGPQLVYYENGKIKDLVSWTPLNSDAEFAINPELTDKFFASIEKDLK